MNFKPSKNDKITIYHAVFDGETQLTAWRRNRQETIRAFQRRTSIKRKAYTVRSRPFIERGGESVPTEATSEKEGQAKTNPPPQEQLVLPQVVVQKE